MLRNASSLLACLFICLVCAPATAAQAKRSVADLVADLKKGEKERLQALQELEALGENAADAAPALVELLATNDEFTRLQTIIALGKIGRAAIKPLTKSLSAQDEEIRFYAVWGLAFVG